MIDHPNLFLRTGIKQREVRYRFCPEINCFFQCVTYASILPRNDMFYYVRTRRRIIVRLGVLICTRGTVTKIPKIVLNDCEGFGLIREDSRRLKTGCVIWKVDNEVRIQCGTKLLQVVSA